MARAALDGNTIGIGRWDTHVVNGAIYQFPSIVLTDFEPNRAACERSRPDRRKTDEVMGRLGKMKPEPRKATDKNKPGSICP
jgi:hypothetical protein